MDMDVEAHIDSIFASPLEGFVRARDAAAAELKRAGDAEGAKRVKALKKPNVAAWGLNQLAREHADQVGELFEATERVRRAQRKVLGGGNASSLREAMGDRKRLVGRLVERAASILEAAGHGTSTQTLTAVGDSLVAIASDEEGAELLRAGRLSRELRAESVVDVGGLSLVPSEPDEDGGDEPVTIKGTESLAAAKDAVAEAKGVLTDARRTASDAEDEAKRLAADAKHAADAAEFARRAAEARKADVAEAERAVAEAEAALRDARRG